VIKISVLFLSRDWN